MRIARPGRGSSSSTAPDTASILPRRRHCCFAPLTSRRGMRPATACRRKQEAITLCANGTRTPGAWPGLTMPGVTSTPLRSPGAQRRQSAPRSSNRFATCSPGSGSSFPGGAGAYRMEALPPLVDCSSSCSRRWSRPASTPVAADTAEIRAGSEPGGWPGSDSEFYAVERVLAKQGFARRPGDTGMVWLDRLDRSEEQPAGIENLRVLRVPLPAAV